jgi:pimeloyl-ACP methyl ester carboxylesterase
LKNGANKAGADFFGRGYSEGPLDLPYDSRLYTTQILLALASSRLAWTGSAGFHLLGYSLGGAIAVSFAAYFPDLVKSLTLVCPGGLIRPKHLSWKGKLLYSEGLFPEWLLQALVRRRLRPQRKLPDRSEAEVVQDIDPLREDPDVRGGSVFDKAVLSASRPHVTVADVISWQLAEHDGFVPAYMSTIRHAPIYDQGEHDWRILAGHLERARSVEGRAATDSWQELRHVPTGLEGGKVLIVLGETDPVIVMDEVMEDATAVLGGQGVEFAVIDGGHEIVITKSMEVCDAVLSFLAKRQKLRQG